MRPRIYPEFAKALNRPARALPLSAHKIEGGPPNPIFSTEAFDATTVDPTSVLLAGAQIRLRGKGYQANVEDVNGDGLMDLVVHIETTALDPTLFSEKAVLEGMTFGGMMIRGSDFVTVVQE